MSVSVIQKSMDNLNAMSITERKKELEHQDEIDNKRKEREKKSPYNRWTQFNNEHTKELMKLAMKYPKAHAILYFLVDQMDEYNAVMVSSQVMEEIIGISRMTVYRNIKILSECGFIAILKSGTSNVYAINDSVYWKSWGNNHKYSKFPANVILTDTEQTEDYRAKIQSQKNKVVDVK